MKVSTLVAVIHSSFTNIDEKACKDIINCCCVSLAVGAGSAILLHRTRNRANRPRAFLARGGGAIRRTGALLASHSSSRKGEKVANEVNAFGGSEKAIEITK